MPTPTWSQLVLGNELKRMREDHDLTLNEAVAPLLDFTATKLSRLERGQSSVRASDVVVLLDRYSATEADRTWAVETAKHCKQRGRWTGYRSTYAKNFRMAVDLEADSTVIRQYQVELAPGLLQTEAYSRALFSMAVPREVDEYVENAVKAKLTRQEVLTKPDAPQVEFILSESAVLRMAGSPEIMREQLAHIARVAELPNVQIQVLPFRARTQPGEVASPFTSFRIPSPGKSGPLEFVYLEDVHDGRYLDDTDSVQAYSSLWARLTGAALDPVESRNYVLRVAADYS
ncbi:helix-turn-helix domain-containing protein [Actinokineospora sp.]|uniref:helix-turn-helix domain-containing protein n=1 Tax=Actinokineospora sp. TaxID=1872133 RepID=UPI004037FDEC